MRHETVSSLASCATTALPVSTSPQEADHFPCESPLAGMQALRIPGVT